MHLRHAFHQLSPVGIVSRQAGLRMRRLPSSRGKRRKQSEGQQPQCSRHLIHAGKAGAGAADMLITPFTPFGKKPPAVALISSPYA